MRALLPFLLACAGCSSAPVYLVVSVGSTSPVTLTELDFTLRNQGMTALVTVMERGADAGSFSIPPSRDVTFQFDPGRSGTIDVAVVAQPAGLTASGQALLTDGSLTLTLSPPGGNGDGPLSDGSVSLPDFALPDLTGCATACVGSVLHVCAGDMMSDTPCPLGCANAGMPHCASFVPRGGAVQPGDLTMIGLGDILLTSGIVVDGDLGSITNYRNPTGSGQIDSGILYRTNNGVAVFVAHSFDFAPGSTIEVRGSRAIALVAQTTLQLDAQLDGTIGCTQRRSMTGGSPGGLPGASGGGPGGGVGGLGNHNDDSGGGGGGYGGAGALGGASVGGGGVVPGAAGPATALDLNNLNGGSGGGGGGGAQSNGGNGGIALQLVAGTSVTVGKSGSINAGGCGGEDQKNVMNTNDGAGGGGGSGGLILIEAPTVHIEGTLAANGGSGAGGDIGSSGGFDGLASAMPAPGGKVVAADSGKGGSGAALGVMPQQGGGGLGIDNGGGGGGGNGYVVLHSYGNQLQIGNASTVSPMPMAGSISTQ